MEQHFGEKQERKNSWISESDREWWEDLENNWKIILLSNYCFNKIGWNLRDCDLECFMFQGNIQNDLVDFAIWSGGNFDFNENLSNISESILNFIISETKMLWCGNAQVYTIVPIYRLHSLKECQGIKCKLSESDLEEIKTKLDYLQWTDTDENESFKIGIKKTWDEYIIQQP